MLCNREIKFRHFLDAARGLGASRIATGHYARVDHDGRRWRLLRAGDRAKDQSYFLHQLGQEQLAATLFPLGGLRKDEVRAMAAAAGLPTAAKKDSTGICFVGERDFREFLGQYLPASPGEIRTPGGQVVGQPHGRVLLHARPARRPALGGRRGFDDRPWYGGRQDVAANVLTVDQGHDSPWLMSRSLSSETAHWIAGAPPSTRFSCTAQTRYRQPEEPCEVTVDDTGALRVAFQRPQRAVTPGQSVVLYDGDTCLGGAVIASTDAPAGTAARALAGAPA